MVVSSPVEATIDVEELSSATIDDDEEAGADDDPPSRFGFAPPAAAEWRLDMMVLI